MGLEGFETNSLIGKSFDNGFSLSEAETTLLTEFEMRLQFSEGTISPSEVPELIEIFIRGIENPATQPDAIGTLMNPQCADVLEDALEQIWSPELDPELKAKMVELAGEPDQATRVQGMCELVIDDLQDQPYPHPLDMGFPQQFAILPEESRLEIGGRITKVAAGSSPDLDNVKLGFETGGVSGAKEVLANAPNPEHLLQEAVSEKWGQSLLIELADDPDLGKMALEVLHNQGSDIIPVLEEQAAEGSQARSVIEWIQTGEMPNPELAINNTLSRIANENDIDAFKELIQNTPDRSALIEGVVAQEDDIAPVLVQMLADSDPRIQVFSMDGLHELGQEAVNDLMRAQGDENPIIREKAELLLQSHFTGDVTWEEAMNFSPENPFSALSDPLGNNGGFGSSSTFDLDIDDFTEQLSHPETCMEALSSLVQAGQPAMPMLCKILIQNRKQKRWRRT